MVLDQMNTQISSVPQSQMQRWLILYLELKFILNTYFFSFTSFPFELNEIVKPPPARISRADRISTALAALKEGGLGPFDMVLEILDEYNPEYWSYRNELYKEKSSKLASILERITTNIAWKHSNSLRRNETR